MNEELESAVSGAIESIKTSWEKAKKLYEDQNKDLQQRVQELESENSELQGKYKEAQDKVDKIEGQLSKTLEQMESMSKATDKGIDAMQLLDVYLVLMENVFESQVHTRLLIMLHGAKEQYTLSELGTAAGISGVQVRQAVFDLRNAGIIEYNEEEDQISLKMRFME